MKILTTVLIPVLLTLEVSSQSSNKTQIIGRVVDKQTQDWLSGATVICLNTNDSSKRAITFTNMSGEFSFDILPLKKKLLYFTFLGYQPLTYQITDTANSRLIDVGVIKMKRLGLTLSQVEITETRKKIRSTKDTIEFSASMFETKYNSPVEELLRKIPGIQIDSDGTIRINGEIVETVMVNGQPFLGMTNKSITRNLQADLIEKIQLINRGANQRSAQDYNGGKSDKIINVTIREDKKNLLSGELSAGYGTANRYDTKANLSHFKNKQQLLITGNVDNIGGSGGVSSGGANTNQIWTTGVSFNTTVSKKIAINAGYSLYKNNTLQEHTSRKEILGSDSNFVYDQHSNDNLTTTNHSINVQLDFKIDSLQTISLSNQVTASTSRSISENDYETHLNQLQKINNSNSVNDANSKISATSNNLRYEKKFAKAGRLLEFNFSLSNGNVNTVNYLTTNNIYDLPAGESLADSINQNMFKKESMQQLFLAGNYTEPIAKSGFLTIFLAEGHLKSTSNRTVFNYDNITGHYDYANDSLSNNFKNNSFQHYARLTWSYRKENFDYSLSLATLQYSMISKDDKINTNRSFNTFLPDANINLTFPKEKHFRLSYRKSTIFPENSQLQTNSDNIDPIYLKRGNPDLKPADTHNLNLSFNIFNSSTLRVFSIILDSKLTANQITDATWFDSLGHQMSKPINLTGSYSFNTSVENSIPLKRHSNRIQLSTNFSYLKSMNSTNGIVGFNKNINILQSIKFIYESKKRIDFFCGATVGLSNVIYNNQKIIKSNFGNAGFNFLGNLYLPFELKITVTFDGKWFTGRAAEYNINPLMLNASISKLIFQHKQGLMQIQCYDLLKQNTNISRSIGINYIEDTRSNVLQRFIIFRFSYFLGKNKN